MKVNSFTENYSNKLRVIFLGISVLILILNFVFFLFSGSSINIGYPIAPNSEIISNFFYFYFPFILSICINIFAIFLDRYETIINKRSLIPVLSALIAIFLATSTTFIYSQIVYGIWLAALLFLTLLLFEFLLPDKLNIRVIHIIKMVVYILSLAIVISALILNSFFAGSISFNPYQLISFWSGILLIISSAFYFSRINEMMHNKNLLKNEFISISIIFSFLPMSVWLMLFAFQPNFQIQPWLFVPFLFGLLWMSGYLFLLVKGQKTYVNLHDADLFAKILLTSAFVGILLSIISFFDLSNMETFTPISLGMGIYIFLFSLGFYSILFGNSSKKLRSKDKYKNFITKESIPPNSSFYEFDSIEEIYQELRQLLHQKYNLIDYHHFILDQVNDKYIAFPFENSNSSVIRFSSDSPLIQTLTEKNDALVIRDFDAIPENLLIEKENLKLLAGQVYLPICVKSSFYGWVTLTLNDDDLENIEETISGITPIIGRYASQIDKVLNNTNLEQRVKNMSSLSRIVQGVNYTLVLDDIYELIYAQTTQIVPSDDFYIILKDNYSNALRFVFYVDMDERIQSKENQKILIQNTPEAEVIESGRGIVVNDYPEFCETNQYNLLSENIQNGMIVPLNSGADTIGCISISQRTVDNTFTKDQLTFSQSVADLVAGAIEKARLLEESEQHAHQLSTLNDLVRTLTSTFVMEDLLNLILQNSIELIACEEARLFTIDETTQELVCQATHGINSSYLKGNRSSINLGLYSEINRNQMVATIDLFSNPDHQILDFYSHQNISVQSLMIIPMVLNNKVLGLIELINRKNKPFFSNNDKQLIQAYSAQAAITLENARLYLRTDQELAERVEELSIMQQIDRELNTSLDLRKTMAITLSWAMRRMKADAGWIGQVVGDQITNITSVGYENALSGTMSLSDIVNNLDFDNYSTLHLRNKELTQFHQQSVEQVLVPIHRDDQIVAVILLEFFKMNLVSESGLNYLERLSDHASIAMINSQLYAEIEKANLAKSEFVALVAHELKNPMTSIKGYTELLSTSAAGEISTTQEKFLSIIRNNTDRMNNLISDLNDLTKIEAGNMRLEPQAVDLRVIFDELVRSINKQIELKQQTLNHTISDNLPNVWADPNRLLQILINLVSNANKYTQENGEISINAEKTLNSWLPGENELVAHIWVQDNGLGISEDDQKSVFQKFFRSEDVSVRANSGTGLGLNITKSLVEMQGGIMWFESEYQKGTTFHFVVPFASSE